MFTEDAGIQTKSNPWAYSSTHLRAPSIHVSCLMLVVARTLCVVFPKDETVTFFALHVHDSVLW